MMNETYLENYNTQLRTVNNAIITLGGIDGSGKGKHFQSRFIQPGLAGYPGRFGNVLVRKETLDNSLKTIIGAPVIINHKDITAENADKERVGVISNAWYNDKDGWYWCEGVIWDETAQNLITDKNWSVSCSYDYLEEDNEGGTENNIPYDREFTKLNFVHLALVDNPRYERANIVFNSKTVENFNEADHPRDEAGRFTEKVRANRKTQHNYGRKVSLKDRSKTGVIIGAVTRGDNPDTGEEMFLYEVEWDNGEIERLHSEKVNLEIDLKELEKQVDDNSQSRLTPKNLERIKKQKAAQAPKAWTKEEIEDFYRSSIAGDEFAKKWEYAKEHPWRDLTKNKNQVDNYNPNQKRDELGKWTKDDALIQQKKDNLIPIEVRPEEIPQFKTKKELGEWFKNIFKELGSVTVEDTGIRIDLYGGNADREAIKRRLQQEPNKAAAKAFEDVVTKSIKVDERPNDEHHIHSQEIYYNKLKLGDDTYDVNLFVDYLEPNQEYRYAGHNTTKIDNKVSTRDTQVINHIMLTKADNFIITDNQENFNPDVKNDKEDNDMETEIFLEALYKAAYETVYNVKDDEDGHWITIKPNGEDGKGRHLFIKDGENVYDAMRRQWHIESPGQTHLFSKNKYDTDTDTDYKKELEKKFTDELIRRKEDKRKAQEEEEEEAQRKREEKFQEEMRQRLESWEHRDMVLSRGFIPIRYTESVYEGDSTKTFLEREGNGKLYRLAIPDEKEYEQLEKLYKEQLKKRFADVDYGKQSSAFTGIDPHKIDKRRKYDDEIPDDDEIPF